MDGLQLLLSKVILDFFAFFRISFAFFWILVHLDLVSFELFYTSWYSWYHSQVHRTKSCEHFENKSVSQDICTLQCLTIQTLFCNHPLLLPSHFIQHRFASHLH